MYSARENWKQTNLATTEQKHENSIFTNFWPLSLVNTITSSKENLWIFFQK